jgi:dihydropteroate synthase
MQIQPEYEDVVLEIRDFFKERLETLTKLGIQSDRICFDPGIGFGKNLDHNLDLLKNIDTLAPAGRPILLGLSRKSFLSKIMTGIEDPADRDMPTAALTSLARRQNVMLHRVHNVKGNLAALRAAESMIGA